MRITAIAFGVGSLLLLGDYTNVATTLKNDAGEFSLGTISDGECLKRSGTQIISAACAGGSGVPSGSILLVDTGSCPSGFTEVAGLNSKFLRGTVAANADVGTTGGSDSITPEGTNSTPTFTGDALGTHTHTFTGNALSGGTRKGGTSNPASIIENNAAVTGSNSSVSAGTPSGTVSAPTFTGTAFDNKPAFTRVIFCKAD